LNEADLASVAGQLAAVLVQYGLPALLVVVLLYVERLAKAAAQEKKLPAPVGVTIVTLSWVTIFGLVVLVAWQMIDDRRRRTWVATGEVLGMEAPLRLELYDSEAYLRETPATDHAPRRLEFVLVTATPLRDRCLQLRILTGDRLPVMQPDGKPLPPFAVSVTSERHVTLLYDALSTQLTFTKGGSGTVAHACTETLAPMVRQAQGG
jgi:hypothetical protein